MIEIQWYWTRWSIGFDDRSSTLPHSSMYLVVVWHSIANHFQDALIRHIIIIISPCRPPSSHNVHQYISCSIGATFRSIDVTEHRCYVRRTLAVAITLFVRLGSMIWVLRCSQYPSTVICTSQMDDEDGDNDGDKQVSFWSISLLHYKADLKMLCY